MNPEECARALVAPIGGLGGRFMTDPATAAEGEDLGFPLGYGFYLLGRFGVLGRVHHDVVHSAAVFWNPELIEREWNAALAIMDPNTAVRHFAACAARYGRERLDEDVDHRRFVELAEKVVDHASVLGVPVFAGWRPVARPDEPIERAMLLLHLLRELRFGLHGVSVVAEGMAPLEAVLAGPGGPSNARLFGWQDPLPDLDMRATTRRAAAEAHTDALSALALRGLTSAEREELVELATTLADTVI